MRIDTLEVMNQTGRIDLREALEWAVVNRATLEASWIEFSGDIA